MIEANGRYLSMVEGDWGIGLPIYISGDNIQSTDTIIFAIKQCENSDAIIENNYTNLTKVEEKYTFDLVISEEQTKLLKASNYVYGIKQYRNGIFLNTLIDSETFEVRKGV